ncbi:hypothetical protein HHK36_028111 [Tetracentron sinense]|uniref:MIF4G domain-containing protein n=1 Tax=Tetracentron sinense TaxID=13715 RepID=A0A835D1U2_TETSI|nr:hypothetical protein HHK36_028111 [Tetracentron sinense]
MSLNQSSGEKSEAQYRKLSRSSSGQHRNFSGGSGKGGGGTAPPLSNSSRSYKKVNGQGGQSRVSSASANSESNAAAAAAAARTVQNGASDAPPSGVSVKPTVSSTQRSIPAVPKVPSSHSSAGASDLTVPTTPAKGDVSRAFPFQFGTISPGFMNGMQIPARTNSAPPNLDEQKRNQARHDSFTAVPTLPIPSVSKQQQPRKDVGGLNQSNTKEPHLPSQARRDVHAQVPAAPTATLTQKSSVLPISGMSMPFQFGAPNQQIHSQGMAVTSLQMPVPLPVGNATQVQQQVFIQSVQTHPLQPQGIMHSGQGLSFAPQIGHQLPPQLSNLGIGVTPQFVQQQAGQFGGPRRAVKITHPETHEELKLDKRTDPYMDGGSLGPRSHPNVPPQSQSIPSYTHAHQINYYPPMQSNSYNPNSIFQTSTSLPLTSTQMTPGSSALRINYSVGQGPQNVSFMNPSTHNPLSVTRIGPPPHGIAERSEPSNMGPPHDVHTVVSTAPSTSVQVTVKPAAGFLGGKVENSSASSHVVNKGESAKLLRPPGEASSIHPQKDSVIHLESSVQQLKFVPDCSVSIPLSVTVKQPAAATAAVSVERPLPSTSCSALAVPLEEYASVLTNTDGRRRETSRRSDSLKDNQKKLSKDGLPNLQPQYQLDAYDSAGNSRSSSLKTSSEVSKYPENTQAPPIVVRPSTSISNWPSQGLEHNSTLKDGISITGKVKETPAPSETNKDIFESTGEQFHDIHADNPDASEVVTDSVQIGEDFTCEPSNTSGLGTAFDNLDAVHHAKQDDCTLQVVQLKEEIMGTVEQGKTELPEEPKQDTSTFEMSEGSIYPISSGVCKQTGQDSNLKETSVENELGPMETEQKESGKEAVGCSSEVERMTSNLVRSITTYSDSNDAETGPSSLVSPSVSHVDTTSLDATMSRSESMDSQKVDFTESDHVVSAVSAEPSSKPDGTVAENTTDGPVYVPVSSSRDKPTLELNRPKSSTGSAKKKRKEILQKADAAGTTSDLYMAYKGPEEKQEAAISSESVDSPSSIVVNHARADTTEKDVVASEEDGQNKAEPDDWEDAADISTSKLKTSDNGEQVHGCLMHHDDDGNDGVMGKKKYSRDFLLTLSKQCPVDLGITLDIAEALKVNISNHVDRDSYPTSGRSIDRPTGLSRPDRRGSVMVDDDRWSKSPGSFASGPRQEIGHGGIAVSFRPGQGGNHGVLRIPRGQTPGQYVGGILSGPVQSPVSQGGMQRNNLDADRWQRSTGIQKGLIPSPQTPSQMMHKAEKKYEVGKVSDKEQAKQRQLKAILNKLTPQNFDKLFEQVKEVNIDTAVTLTGVISQIFDKALMEPTFCEMYANFCHHLAGELPDFSEDDEKITFKRLLLNKCQEEFERGEREQAEANRIEEEGEIKRTEEERVEKKTQARRRMLGNIRLIGELYKKKMLTERIMHECIKKLLGQYQNPDEEDIEALCKLMSTIGEMIDHPKAKEHMDAYFIVMTKLSNNLKLSSRVRFMLKDSIDLRKNKWQQRRKVEGPKKIEEVHRDAAQERQAQTSRLARGSGNSSSSRRGQPIDFGPRGSTMLSSPNAQMGGFRGLPSQARGYGAQDVRLEERHPYESRTLSVPLPQRPIEDDSITLGPQGGLARGMSRGQPLMSSVPLADISPIPGDSRRTPAGHSSVSAWAPYNSKEELMPRYIPEGLMGLPAYDQPNSQEHNTYFGSRDLRNADRSFDRSMATSHSTRAQGSSVVTQTEERMRRMSISAIREFYRYLLSLCLF